ncbi:MAG: class I SAM-dependent methyltransferase [Minisyncoccales bacterium]
MEGFLKPEQVLFRLDFKDGQVIADFGSGRGEWVIFLAKKLTNSKIFAIDILNEALSVLEKRLSQEKIDNVEIKRADVEKNCLLLDRSCDWVLMTNLLFEIDDIHGVFKEARRVLKEKGKLLVVDWKKNVNFGPSELVDFEKVKKIAQEQGFQLEKEFEAGAYHLGLVFQKK